MLSFPLILTGVLTAAGALLAVILLVVLLPKRESSGDGEKEAIRAPLNSRNGEGLRH